MSMFLVVLVGVVGGLAAALQGSFVGILEEEAGTLASTFVTYGLGGLVVSIVMLVSGGAGLSDLRGVPWWAFTAGLMGLLIVGSIGITVSNLGIGAGLTLFTATTIIIGALIDNIGLFAEAQTLDLKRVVGIAIVIFGTWLVVGAGSSSVS